MKKSSLPLTIFQNASKSVPAYQKLLKSSGISAAKIHTIKDFQKLPLIDKRSYIYSNAFEEIFPHKKVPTMAYASSGSSGIPTFWFRNNQQEEIAGKIHEKIFRDIFHLQKKDKTLVVVCFAMGIWIAGNYTLTACRQIADKGYNVTTIAPGIEQEDILQIFSRLAPRFQKVVLAGYPPFLMNVISEARRRKIVLQNDIKVLTAGDKFPEVWRTDFLDFLHITNPYYNLVGIYGSADAGILGYETPLSIFIRRSAAKNRSFSKTLFGDHVDLPAVVQYDPKYIFFEEVQGELVLTANTAAPLIRYNIHDVGNIIPYLEMKKLIKGAHLTREAQRYGLQKWRLPFLVLKGRTDVAATFYALNILPEHIRTSIESKRLAKFLSGNFFVYNKTMYKSREQRLYIKLELNAGVRPSRRLHDLATKAITQGLLKWNIEFRKLYSTIGEKAVPTITFHSYGNPLLEPKSQKRGVVYLKGKKPKVIR